MSDQDKTGGPAFPLPLGTVTTAGTEGMTLRDHFAAQALAGYLASYADAAMTLPNPEQLAMQAYAYADAMIKARVS